MAKILHVDSSSRTETSVSRQLSKYFVEQWVKSHPEDTVAYRDLVKETVDPLSESSIDAMFTPAESRSKVQKADYANLIENNVGQVIESDIFVFGVPIYNFSVPGVFKSYIDRIVVAGKSFSFGPEGFKGLLQNKKVFVIRSSGSNFDGAPMNSYDFHEPFLRAIFGFIGITDITFVKVYGHSPEEIGIGTAQAKKEIDALCAGTPVAVGAR